MISRQEIVRVARSLVGVPYRHQGRCLDRGLDCAGVLYQVSAQLGVPVVDDAVYRPDGNGKKLLKCLKASNFRRKPADRIQPGDIVLLKMNDKKVATHAAILVAPGRIVHSTFEARKVVETTFTDAQLSNTAGVWAFPGVD